MKPILRAAAFVLGIVVVASVSSYLLLAEPPQAVGTWAPAGSVPQSVARTGAASVALDDGTTLIAGGRLADGAATDDVSVFDPVTNTAASIGQLLAARVGAAAALLEDGRVLVAGGTVGDAPSADVEIFDPAAGSSSLAAVMAEARTGLGAARLHDGTVLLVGGASAGGTALALAEIVDPATGSITSGGALATARAGATATTLIDGRVLVAGGSDGTNDLASAEIYEPATGTFAAVPTALSVARSGHTATLLPHNAGVLIAGGTAGGAATTASDVFLPALFPDPYSWGMGSFAATDPLEGARSGAVSGPLGDDGFAYTAGGGSGDAETYRFATVRTDKDDYAPGEPAVITGSGWEPGELVTLVFQEDPAVHPDYIRETEADENGNFEVTDWSPEEHDLGVRFYLMATGEQSRRRAQTTFTDAVSLETREATCTTAESTFTLGETVCARATGLGMADTHHIEWFNPSNVLKRTSPNNAGGNMTDTYTPDSVGTWTVKVIKNSDSSVQATATFTVSAAATIDPTVTTAIHNGTDHATSVTSVPLGSTVHDSVTVTGSAGTAIGNVTFTFYNNGTCTAPAAATSGTFSLSGGAVDATSFTQGPLAAGSYSFKASYAGDGNYNAKDSDCEPFTVEKAELTLESAVHDASHADKTNGNVPLGSVMHDTAKITAGLVEGFDPPAITFEFYTNGTCTDGSAVANTGDDEGDTTRDRSAASLALGAGAYAYKAFVAANANYEAADSGCEPFTVDKGQLTLESAVHDASHADQTNGNVPLGSVMHDTAKITAGLVEGFDPPAITFEFYTNGTCTDGSAVANTGDDEGDTTRDRSAASLALGAGAYAYKAFVAANANYEAADSGCEPFTVDKAQLTVTTVIHDSSHTPVEEVVYLTAVHDKATVTDEVPGFPSTGAVTFTFGATCGTTAIATSGAENGGVASVSTVPATVGTYYFQATVAGDDNYLGDTSDCEELTVNPREALVNYIGQLEWVTSGSSSTTAQVTLSASMQDPTGDALVNATAEFVQLDPSTLAEIKVLAAGVKVSPVPGQPDTGTANTIVTLSTGQYGAETYLILVRVTGNYTNEAQPEDDKTAYLVVMKPAGANEATGAGTIDPLASRAGTYAGGGDDPMFTVGMKYNKSGTNPQGKIVLIIPQADGSTIYVKSNSISSMALKKGSPDRMTIYTKATIYRVDGDEVTPIDGNVTLRMDIVDYNGAGPTNQVGFTVLSSKTSQLYYSNNWVLSGTVWKTVAQDLATGSVSVN